ncbi:MAG: hypothetical protein IPK53_13850 [bacterium]|nr:hypothetical protein [bacterium]
MLKKFLPVLLLLAVCLAQAAEFKAPVLLTSGGQSADLQLVKTLLTRENIAFNVKPLATAADLEQVGSVIIVLGGSSKGLGAAKVSAEEESRAHDGAAWGRAGAQGAGTCYSRRWQKPPRRVVR